MSASDIAAWWGAIIATIVLGWDVFKWKKTGYQLRLSVLPSRQAVEAGGFVASPRYIIIEVVNIGDKRTEITHVVGSIYKSHLQRLRKKPAESFLVLKPEFSSTFPCLLEPGQRWMGGINQTEELGIKSRSGLFYCGIVHSGSLKPLTTRLIIKD